MSGDDDMKLPEGKTCKDCKAFESHCTKLFGCNPDNTTCDFSPSRFRKKAGMQVEFYDEVCRETNPLLSGYGKITSDHLQEFVGKKVLVKIEVQG